MSTVTVIPLDVYTLVYQYEKLKVPSVFDQVIDILIHRDCIRFQPLGRDKAWVEDDPLYTLIGNRITLKNGRVTALYRSDTLMVVTNRT